MIEKIHNKKSILEKFLHELETDLYDRTMHHLRNSLKPPGIRYSKAGSSDIKLYTAGQRPRYIPISRSARDFLEYLVEVPLDRDPSIMSKKSTRLNSYLRAAEKGGIRYAVSLMGHELEGHLYELADSEVKELESHREFKKREQNYVRKALRERSWILAAEKKEKKRKKLPALVLILLNLFSLSLLTLTFANKSQSNITANATSTNYLFYPAIVSFLLAVFVLFFLRRSRNDF